MLLCVLSTQKGKKYFFLLCFGQDTAVKIYDAKIYDGGIVQVQMIKK